MTTMTLNPTEFWAVDTDTLVWHFVFDQPVRDGAGRPCGVRPLPACTTVCGRLVHQERDCPKLETELMQVCATCRAAATRRIVEARDE